MHELIDDGTLPPQTTIYPQVDEDPEIGSIKYVLIHKELMPESNIPSSGAIALRMKYAIRKAAGSPIKWFGLSAYNPLVEVQPLFVSRSPVAPLRRVKLRKTKKNITLEGVLAQKAAKAGIPVDLAVIQSGEVPDHAKNAQTEQNVPEQASDNQSDNADNNQEEKSKE